MFVHEICTQTLCEYIYNTSCVSDGGTLCVKIDDGRVKLIYLVFIGFIDNTAVEIQSAENRHFCLSVFP